MFTSALSKGSEQLYSVAVIQSPERENPVDVREPHERPATPPQKQPVPWRGKMEEEGAASVSGNVMAREARMRSGRWNMVAVWSVVA